MKHKGDVIFILFVVGVVLISLRDKIFKKKVDVNTPSSSIDTIPSPPKPINTENLGLNTPTTTTIKDKYNNLKVGVNPLPEQYLTEEERDAINRKLEIGKIPKLGDIIQTDKGMFQFSIIEVGGIVGIKRDWIRYLPLGATK
jgi:hypothetical protein